MNNTLACVSQKIEDPGIITNKLIEACLDAKGRDIVALDISKITDMTRNFLIISGRSDRQVQGIGHRILEAAKEMGIEPISVEGFETGHWVLIDLDDVVVHIFFEPVRARYDIEGLWNQGERLNIQSSSEQHLAA